MLLVFKYKLKQPSRGSAEIHYSGGFTSEYIVAVV